MTPDIDELARLVADRLRGDLLAGAWMSTEHAAAYCGMTVGAMKDLRTGTKGPAFSRVAERTVRYHRADLDAYLEAGRVRA